MAPGREYTIEIPELLDNSIEGQLKRFQLQLQRGNQTVTGKHQLLSQVPLRLFQANVASLYLEETVARRTRKRAKRYRRSLKTAKTRRATVFAMFVDYILPILQTGSVVTRRAAEGKFEQLLQHGKRWAKLVHPYGPGILLLIPYGLTNDRFRSIGRSEVNDLVIHLDSYRLSLRADIQNLTPLHYSLIEDRPLLDQKLYLEMLLESQIASGEHAAKSLEELFKFTDEFSYFMSEAAPGFYQPSPEGPTSSLASPWEQLDSNTAVPGYHTTRQEDEGIVSTVDDYILPSAFDPLQMNSFT